MKKQKWLKRKWWFENEEVKSDKYELRRLVRVLLKRETQKEYKDSYNL